MKNYNLPTTPKRAQRMKIPFPQIPAGLLYAGISVRSSPNGGVCNQKSALEAPAQVPQLQNIFAILVKKQGIVRRNEKLWRLPITQKTTHLRGKLAENRHFLRRFCIILTNFTDSAPDC